MPQRFSLGIHLLDYLQKKKISKKCVSISFSHVFFCLGDVIQQGQVVAVLSAMKMEMAVQSKVAGKVSDNFYRV